MQILEVTMKAVKDLNAAKYNPRKKLKPSDALYQDIKASIAEFGFCQNLVWNQRTRTLVGGHQRVLVATREFKATHLPTAVVDISEEDEQRLNVMLNAIGEGNWNNAKLAKILQDLNERVQADVYRLGLSAQTVDELLGRKKPTPKQDPDEAAPKPTVPKTKAGDLYRFVSADADPIHWLMCGDSTSSEEVATLMQGQSARILFTDPPYRVSYDNAARGHGTASKGTIDNDELRAGALRDFLRAAFTAAHEATIANTAAYVFYASKTHREFETALEQAGWEVRQQLIWTKQLALSRADYHWAHEPCLLAGKPEQETPWFSEEMRADWFWAHQGADYHWMHQPIMYAAKDGGSTPWFGDRTQTTVWAEKRDSAKALIHPTQKPIGLARKAFGNSTLRRDNVLDLFGGSGSTLIAAEMEGRNAYVMEQDPGWCDSTVTRYLNTFENVEVYRNGSRVEEPS
jgi:DNA modification methylase